MMFYWKFPLLLKEKDDSFKGSIGNIYQSFAGEDIYPSLEEKAANLLCFVTKNHSFYENEKLIDDHTLVALTKRCIGMTILKSIWDGKVLEKYFVVVSWLWEILQKSQNYRKLINLENQFNKTLVGLADYLSPLPVIPGIPVRHDIVLARTDRLTIIPDIMQLSPKSHTATKNVCTVDI